MDTIAALRKYNRWRRGLDAWHEDAGPNPKDIGEQIDAAADELERLRALSNEALDLLATIFDAYENGTPCYEDPDDCSGFLGYAIRLDDATFHRAADVLNAHRPRNGETVTPNAADQARP